MNQANVFKIMLVGDQNDGKTSYLNRLLYGEFSWKSRSTTKVETRCLKFNTNYGEITFNVSDFPGQDMFAGLRDKHCSGTQGVVILFDPTSIFSIITVLGWVKFVKEYSHGGPIIICGNKCDLPGKKNISGMPSLIDRISEYTIYDKPSDKDISDVFDDCIANCSYYDISVKSNYNLESPFLTLARELTGHSDLLFLLNQ